MSLRMYSSQKKTKQRLDALEVTVEILQEKINKLIEEQSPSAPSCFGSTISLCPPEKQIWIVCSSNDADIEQLTAHVIALYTGRNIQGFAAFIASCCSTSAQVHFLVDEDNPDPANARASVIIKENPIGKKIVLELHSSSHEIPLVADHYMDLFSDKEECVFAEVGTGSLDDELRRSGCQPVKCIKTICFVSHVDKTKIFASESDQRRFSFPTADGKPSPLFSYLTASQKRLTLYGNPRVFDRATQTSNGVNGWRRNKFIR